MSVLNKEDRPVKWIRAKNLSIRWSRAQRGLDQAWANKIAENFDPDAVGVVVVTTPNGDGAHHVVDGQHRVEAIRQLWGDSTFIPCQVLDRSDPAEAADLWLKINESRKGATPVERFHIAVEAGRPREVEVHELLTDMGYTVAMGSADGCISAITACLSIHDKGGIESLKDTLLLLRSMWGMERDAYHNSILRGVALFLRRHGEGAKRERLVKKATKKFTPASLLGASRTSREMFQGTLKENVTRVLVSVYNHNLRSERRLEA